VAHPVAPDFDNVDDDVASTNLVSYRLSDRHRADGEAAFAGRDADSWLMPALRL
jgi:hypothetical protein